MALAIRDGNGAVQNVPNAGIDNVYYAVDATITTSATSATDIYQFKGAAGVVARLRRIEAWSLAVVTATSFAGTSTLIKLFRRSTAGTVGTWTAITGTGIAQSAFANAASQITLNVAGNTAFTAGTTQGEIRRGFLNAPETPANSALGNTNSPMVWMFGVNGDAPVSFTGTADYINVNLNAVTPIVNLLFNFEWEEATI